MDRPLYNQLARYYESLEGRDWNGEVKLVASVLRHHGCRSVVDLGCGTGYQARSLTKMGFGATGLDISRQNIRFAKKKAEEEGVSTRFIAGSYYGYRPVKSFDAALCLNWSIPVKDAEVRRFLDNASSLLRPGGLLIFDYEKVSEIAWKDVGKPTFESWEMGNELVVRVCVGQVESNVLSSRDIYVVLPKQQASESPTESHRYDAITNRKDARIYKDHSYVRFFSLQQIRHFATNSGFRMVANHALPRKQYKRNYAVLRKGGSTPITWKPSPPANAGEARWLPHGDQNLAVG